MIFSRTAPMRCSVAAALCFLPYATVLSPSSRLPDFKEIQHWCKEVGVDCISESLIESAPLELSNLPETEAVNVEFIGRTPRLQFVLIEVNSSWKPTLIDKTLANGWQKRIGAALEGVDLDQVRTVGASALAEDLCRLLVDPSPRYGVLLSSREGIPVDYQSSDALRDLKRRGKRSAQIRRILLGSVNEEDVAPPSIRRRGRNEILVFYSWHYFGGELSRWSVRLSPSRKVERDILAVKVGSYDYYM